MRSICAVVALTLGLVSSAPASADYSKAWQAAKDNLPANTQMALVVDVAAIAKLPSFNRVFDAVRAQERDFEMGYTLLKGACNVTNPVTMVDGIVLAGDMRNKESGVGFVQVTIDRTKASACLESVLKLVGGRKQVSVKQDGIYTVATVGNDSAYFAWVAPNVVVFSIQPDKKATLDAYINQKGWAKSPAAALVGKMDLKAALSGVFTVDKVDVWFPVAKAFGSVTISGGTITGSVTATYPDAKAATAFAAEINEERDRDLKKDRTPAAVKKLMNAVKIATSGNELTAKGSMTEKDFGDALIASLRKKEKAETSGVDEQKLVTEMEGFRNKMCACKDKACADKVTSDLTKWSEDIAKRVSTSTKPSPDLAKKSADIMTRYAECMTKLMTQ